MLHFITELSSFSLQRRCAWLCAKVSAERAHLSYSRL